MLWIHFSRYSGVGIFCSCKSSFQCRVNKNDSGKNVSGMSQFTADCNFPKEGFILVTSIVFFFLTINSFQSLWWRTERGSDWQLVGQSIQGTIQWFWIIVVTIMCSVYLTMFAWPSSSCYSFWFCFVFFRSTGPLKFPKISSSKESFQMSR